MYSKYVLKGSELLNKIITNDKSLFNLINDEISGNNISI